MFFVGFMPQSALVWLREKLSQRHGAVEAAAAPRAGAADRARGHRPLRPHAARRGGHQQHRGAGPRRHRRPDEQHAHLRRRSSSTGPTRRSSTSASAATRCARACPASRATAARRVPGVDRHRTSAQNLCHLRSYGIRTATDLIQAYEQALRRGGTDAGPPESRGRAAARRAATLPNVPRAVASVRTIQTIIDTLPDEEWFVQVRNWRNPEFGAVDAWYRYLDGRDWTPRRMRAPKRVKQAMRPLESVPMIVRSKTSRDAELAGALAEGCRSRRDIVLVVVEVEREPAAAGAGRRLEAACRKCRLQIVPADRHDR